MRHNIGWDHASSEAKTDARKFAYEKLGGDPRSVDDEPDSDDDDAPREPPALKSKLLLAPPVIDWDDEEDE